MICPKCGLKAVNISFVGREAYLCANSHEFGPDDIQPEPEPQEPISEEPGVLKRLLKKLW